MATHDDPLSIGTHSFTATGAHVTYFVQGHGPLLFIQAAGWGISSRYLRIGLAPLEAHFKLVYIEPRGSGESSRPEKAEDMSDGDMADDLDRLRAHLDVEQMDLLGHSNGGTIALLYAEQHPARVRRLVILTHWLSGYDDSAEWKSFVSQRRRIPVFMNSIAAIEDDTKPADDDAWFAHLRRQLEFYLADPVRHYPAFREAMGRPSRWVNDAQREANKKKKVEAFGVMDKVTAKTLCMGCDEDRSARLM